MGYFSNSTEGEAYWEKYCCKCEHDRVDKEFECPVWEAHMLWSYNECDKPDSILHRMIPRNGIKNEKCIFYQGKEI